MILTSVHISKQSRGQNSLYYTCTRLRGRGRTHTSALIYAYYNKIQSRLTSTSIHFLSLSTRDSPQLKTENSIPYIFWRSSKGCVATAIKSSSDRHKIFWRSPKDCVTYAMQSLWRSFAISLAISFKLLRLGHIDTRILVLAFIESRAPSCSQLTDLLHSNDSLQPPLPPAFPSTTQPPLPD